MMAARTRLLFCPVLLGETCPRSASRPFHAFQTPIKRRALPLPQARTFSLSRKYRQQPPPPPSPNDNPLPPPPPGSIPPNLYFPQEPPAPPTSIFVGTPQPPPPKWDRARVWLWFKRGSMLTLYVFAFVGAYVGGLEITSKFFPFDVFEPGTPEDSEFCVMIWDWLDTNEWVLPAVERSQQTNDADAERDYIASVAAVDSLGDNPFLTVDTPTYLHKTLRGSRALAEARAANYIRLPTKIPCDTNYALYPSGRLESFWLGPALTGWPGTVHGGAIATVLQHSMQKAVMYVSNAPYLPITLSWGGAAMFRFDVSDPVHFKIEYMRPISAGNVYTVLTLITHVTPSGEVTQTATQSPGISPPEGPSHTSTTLPSTPTKQPWEQFVVDALNAASLREGKPFKETPEHFYTDRAITCLMFPSFALSKAMPVPRDPEMSQVQTELCAKLAEGMTPDLRGRYFVTASIMSDDHVGKQITYAAAEAAFDVVDFDGTKWGGTLTTEMVERKVEEKVAKLRAMLQETGMPNPRLHPKTIEEKREGRKKGGGWGKWF